MKWGEVRPRNRSMEVGRVMGEFVGDEWLVIGAGLPDSDTPH